MSAMHHNLVKRSILTELEKELGDDFALAAAIRDRLVTMSHEQRVRVLRCVADSLNILQLQPAQVHWHYIDGVGIVSEKKS